MNIGKEFLIKSIIFICVIFTQTISAFALNHSLNAIDVKQNEEGNYNIILNIEGSVNIKKTINSDNTITLLFNSTIPSDSLEIIYDNTSDINNVIVQKKNADKTLVIIEGKNISNADVYTKDTSTGLLLPLDDNSMFLGMNNNVFGILSGIMFLFTMFYLNTRKTKTPELKISKPLQRTTPSIGYNVSNKGYVSVPKGFVINRYMENEKIRKVG